MSNIYLISKREYLTRVRKKSFIIMTLLSPLMIVTFYGFIFYFSINKDLGESSKKIIVIDSNTPALEQLQNSKTLQFEYIDDLSENPENYLRNHKVYGILQIPKIGNDAEVQMQFYSEEQPSLTFSSSIEEKINTILKNNRLKKAGIAQQVMDSVNEVHAQILTNKLTDEGIEKGDSSVTTAIGFISAILIYMFIFLYGVQIMRGVIEEKTNRIVEVIISSVKPFELMLGKIIGIACVGLTQFVLWMALVAFLSPIASQFIMDSIGVNIDQISQANQALPAASPVVQQNSSHEIGGFISAMGQYNFTLIIGMFVFYFLGGYLLYGALFAAIGSAVDSETDTQQFMFPITMPLIFAFVMAQSAVISSPNSSISIWLSLIPFTSPVVMMVRIPFGVPMWQLALSALLLILGFLFTVWVASRIYRIGILMYGKKPTYKDLIKWFYQSNSK